MAELKLEIHEPLETRIKQFKKDPEKMKDVNDFLNQLLEKATTEAEVRNCGKPTKRVS